MRSIGIAIICIVLVLLIGVSSQVSDSGGLEEIVTSGLIAPVAMTSILPYCKSLGQKVITIENRLLRFTYIGLYLNNFYMPLMLRWASWIWLPRRAKPPYRNPLRAFRLNKKQRKRLRRRLSECITQNSALLTPVDQDTQEFA